MGPPDGDVARTRGAELFEVQATLVEVPIRGEALPHPAGGIGLVLVDAEDTRAELDDASGGDVTPELRARVIAGEPRGLAGTRRAEAEMGGEVDITNGDEAPADDGDGVELTRAAAQALVVDSQRVDGRVVAQERFSPPDVDLGGTGSQADREGAGVVFKRRDLTEPVCFGII